MVFHLDRKLMKYIRKFMTIIILMTVPNVTFSFYMVHGRKDSVKEGGTSGGTGEDPKTRYQSRSIRNTQ